MQDATFTLLQDYLRYSARQRYEAVAIPPFTAFVHRSNDFSFFNYAIPDSPVGGNLDAPLAELCALYAARARLPRFEFIEQYAPELAPALLTAGFEEESRVHLMVCTPTSQRPASEVAGLQIVQLRADSSLDEARDFLTTQRQGFNPAHTQEASTEEAEEFLQDLGNSGAFLARVGGAAAGVAYYTAPQGGLTEVAGIATLEAFRRRGIASALTAAAVGDAFAGGVAVAFLSAADAAAGRVYERVGFRPFATMLAYHNPTRDGRR